MKNRFSSYIQDILLVVIYICMCTWLFAYYPLPQCSWDSFYYVKTSITLEYGIRPSGYAYFLNYLYAITPKLHFIAVAQLSINFLAIILFLKAVNKVLHLLPWQYVILGLILCTEPIALYHGNNVLSDSLFASCSLIALAALLKYLQSRNYWYLAIHALLIFVCIEIRHIALFYPFFTCFIIFLFSPGKRASFIAIAAILITFFGLYKWHTYQNKKHYGVSVYSAFSGWTHANNAMYGLAQINPDPNTIENKDLRWLHIFIKSYLDSTGFKPEHVGSGYLWDDRSPLEVLRKQWADSFHLDYNASWYYAAPYFHYYGTYLQKHYPLTYIKTYMVPNFKSLLVPITGEMCDYRITPYSSPELHERYGVTESSFSIEKDIYKTEVCGYISVIYKVLLRLSVFSVIVILLSYKRLGRDRYFGLLTLILFTLGFYAFTLYSSWFMYRYLLPVLPLMYLFVIIGLQLVFTRKQEQVE